MFSSQEKTLIRLQAIDSTKVNPLEVAAAQATMFANKATKKSNNSSPPKYQVAAKPAPKPVILAQIDKILSTITIYTKQELKHSKYQEADNLLKKNKKLLGNDYTAYQEKILYHPIELFEGKLNDSSWYGELRKLAETYFQSGSHQLAAHALTKLMTNRPNDYETQINLASTLISMKSYKKAALICNQILQSKAATKNMPLKVQAHYYHGLAKYYLNRYDKAKNDFSYILNEQNRKHLSKPVEQCQTIISTLKEIEYYHQAQAEQYLLKAEKLKAQIQQTLTIDDKPTIFPH